VGLDETPCPLSGLLCPRRFPYFENPTGFFYHPSLPASLGSRHLDDLDPANFFSLPMSRSFGFLSASTPPPPPPFQLPLFVRSGREEDWLSDLGCSVVLVVLVEHPRTSVSFSLPWFSRVFFRDSKVGGAQKSPPPVQWSFSFLSLVVRLHPRPFTPPVWPVPPPRIPGW